ncbi:MAG TPA: transposase family protein [Phormidium sp.]
MYGVRPETFNQMLEAVRTHSGPKQKTRRPGKLCLEDQLLMTLEYWREYRTYFHIGQSWGVNESTAYPSSVTFRIKQLVNEQNYPEE